MAVSARIEDYMEEIFALEIEGVAPTVTELATRTGVSKPTVVAAVRRLSEDGLVLHEHYGDLSLTDRGRELALAIYRRHEHLTFLFSEMFGIGKDRSEAIACAMEHELGPFAGPPPDAQAELRDFDIATLFDTPEPACKALAAVLFALQQAAYDLSDRISMQFFTHVDAVARRTVGS